MNIKYYVIFKLISLSIIVFSPYHFNGQIYSIFKSELTATRIRLNIDCFVGLHRFGKPLSKT